MNCTTCRDLLQRRLDGESISHPVLQRHLDDCGECRQAHLAGERLLAGVARIKAPVASAALVERITQRVISDRRAQRRRRVLITLSLAASLLLVFATLAWGPTHVPAPIDLARADDAPAAPELRDSVAQAGSAVVAISARAADDAVDPARELLPVLAGPMLAELDLHPIVEGPAVALNDAGQGLKAGFEPMTSSARRAIGLFLRDLTPGDPDAKPGL